MPYLLGWCCLIAAIYLDAWALPLVVSGGALLGLGSAGFYMLWQRLFASQDSDTATATSSRVPYTRRCCTSRCTLFRKR